MVCWKFWRKTKPGKGNMEGLKGWGEQRGKGVSPGDFWGEKWEQCMQSPRGRHVLTEHDKEQGASGTGAVGVMGTVVGDGPQRRWRKDP